MSPERWKRIDALFNEVAELDASARAEVLDRECAGDPELKAEVLALLASDEQVNTGFVKGHVDEGIASFGEAQQAVAVATRKAGPYILTKELGRGGMGTVYLGERADGQYHGEVAVKLVRPGMDTDFFLMRFKRERQALARLQHPNIARLLDSGTTEDGMPYIVMERVEGSPITTYCRNQRLEVKDILRIYIDVCAAVAHAHRNFIVHRDLKPGNILVEESGTAKLLDFGICKLLIAGGGAGLPGASETVETSQMMTPDYASPEQVCGDAITIASDIYSLGAVLYELLTHKRPHRIEKLTPQGLVDAICEQDIVPPSHAVEDKAISRALEGDLDTIVLKAMQKDPQRRYVSVEQFGEDLRRVLNDEPVLARPDTAMYRTTKFIRRHRGAVAAAVTMTIALSSGVVAYARQADLARRQSIEARALANAMMFDIHDMVKDLPGALKARENIVRVGLGYLDRLSAQSFKDASLRLDLASAYLRMGEIQGAVMGSHTGDTEGALASFKKGLEAIEPLPVPSNRQATLLKMDFEHRIGHVFDARGSKESVEHYDRGIEAGVALYSRHPDDGQVEHRLAAIYGAKALILRKLNQVQASADSIASAEKVLRHILERNPDDRQARADLAANMSTLGTLQQRTGQLKAAKETFEQAVAEWNELVRQEPASLMFTRERMLAYSHLGDVLGNPNYDNLKDPEGAKKAFDSMVDAARQRFEANPDDQGAIIDYGMALGRVAAIPLQPVDERLELYQRAAKQLAGAIERDPSNSTVRMNLASQKELAADLLAENGRQADARSHYLAALAVLDGSTNLLPAARRVQVTCLQKLGEDAARRGNLSEATTFAQRALKIGEATPQSPTASAIVRPKAYVAMASVESLLHRPAEARKWREKALQEYQRLSNEKDFAPAYRKLMKELEATLAK
jgi:serine/threonine protein kinase